MEQTLNYYTVVQRRASGNQSELEKISLMFRNFSAGLIGEKRVLFTLKELDIPHAVIHNFTSFNEVGHPIQMDIIFICSHFVVILEVKNITGHIDFDSARRQFIRKTLDGRVESFMNPVDQVLRHKYFLESLLLTSSELIPVEAAVVIANHSTVIGNISLEVPIFNVAGTRHVIMELCKKYRDNHFNMSKVRQLIMSHFIERSPSLPKGNFVLRLGVLCNRCGHKMQHFNGGFKCLNCNRFDKNNESLLHSLWEYSILYGTSITNKQFRDFTGVASASTAKKILRRLNLPMHGSNRSTTYSLVHLKKLI